MQSLYNIVKTAIGILKLFFYQHMMIFRISNEKCNYVYQMYYLNKVQTTGACLYII